MTQSTANLFEEALKSYQDGATPEELIPIFKDICRQAPKSPPAWSCLAWLYLLDNEPEKALKAAKKGHKLDPNSLQGRINLVLAMLETGQSGVRQHIETVQEVIAVSGEARRDVEENLQDGLSRKPDWEELKRVQKWLL